MAVLTAQGISSVAFQMLSRSLVLPRTITVVPGDEFAGDNGDTITLRVPQPATASTQSSAGDALTPADVTEIAVPVQVGHVYHLKNVTDQELSLKLEDFARQVTLPQVTAVARGVENKVITAMNGVTADATIKFAKNASESDTINTMVSLREWLSGKENPAEDRYLAASPQIVSRLLSVPDFVRNDSVGDGGLRAAIVGRIYGLEVVEVTGLTAGTAVAYHKSGFGLGVRPPVAPRGATESAAINQDGIGLRQIFQYDAGHAQDQSLVSTFAGAAPVWENGVTATDNRRFIRVITSAS